MDGVSGIGQFGSGEFFVGRFLVEDAVVHGFRRCGEGREVDRGIFGRFLDR